MPSCLSPFVKLVEIDIGNQGAYYSPLGAAHLRGTPYAICHDPAFRDPGHRSAELARLLKQLGKTTTAPPPPANQPRLQLTKMPITSDTLFGRDKQLTM